MNETTMSPIAFKRQVEQVISELGKCVQLCQDIKHNRRMRSHENLDRLEEALESAEGSIPQSYDRLRRTVGSQLDIGDGKLPYQCYPDLTKANSKQKEPGLR
jgi:hypothetical protein